MPWEDGTKAGRKNSRPTKPMGFDGYVESMGKKKEAEEKARQNTRTERERERRKEGKIQAGGEGTKGHTPCLGNGLQFQKFFFSFFRGAFFWGRGMSNTYYEGRERERRADRELAGGECGGYRQYTEGVSIACVFTVIAFCSSCLTLSLQSRGCHPSNKPRCVLQVTPRTSVTCPHLIYSPVGRAERGSSWPGCEERDATVYSL